MPDNVYSKIGYPYLSPPDKFVQDEYNKRIRERNLTFAGKTPFIKITSGYTSKKDGSRQVLN